MSSSPFLKLLDASHLTLVVGSQRWLQCGRAVRVENAVGRTLRSHQGRGDNLVHLLGSSPCICGREWGGCLISSDMVRRSETIEVASRLF